MQSLFRRRVRSVHAYPICGCFADTDENFSQRDRLLIGRHMGRTKRERLATGIYKDKGGIAVVTKIHNVQREQRFSLDSDLSKLIAFRANWIVEREGEPQEPTAPYWEACQRYLKTIPDDVDGSKRKANAYNDLHCWRHTFHGVNVKQITAAIIKQQLAEWAPDFKPSTLNKRRQELKNLFTFLNGKDGKNPVRDVSKSRERYDDARGQRPEVVEAVLTQITAPQTRIFLRAVYETSLPPIDLTRITEATFRPRERTIFVPERLKGAGSPAVTMTLTKAGVKALKAFFAAGLEGKRLSTGTMHRDFTEAVTRAKAAWKGVWPAPDNFHPYDLRHSRLTEALRHSGNLQGVQKLGRHKRIETTMRYLRALESESMKDVTRAMDGAIRTVPSVNVKTRQNRPKRTDKKKAGSPRKKR